MNKAVAFLLTFAIGLNAADRFILVSHFITNQKQITERYCINKAKPQLHCNGKCHLAKQLDQKERQSKALDNELKNKELALPPVRATQAAMARYVMSSGLNVSGQVPVLLQGILKSIFIPPDTF